MKICENYKYTVYASYGGYFVQAIINNFIPLLFVTFQKSFSISYGKISALIVLNFAAQLVTDLFSAKFLGKIGYRKAVVAAHFFAFSGLLMLGILPYIMDDAFFAIILSIIVYATGSGLIEVIISPLVDACPSEKKSASMSLLHSFYCWGQVCVVLFSTIFFSNFGTENWRYSAFLWSIVPLINGIFFLFVPIPKILSQNKGMGIKGLLKSKLFLTLGVVMLCAGASEIAMSQWASTFAESGLKVSKAMGDLLGPCLFAALMGISRVLYSFFTQKLSLKKAMVISSVLCVIGYLVTCLSPDAIMSLLGCGLCGFSVGIMWPGAFSLASEELPTGGTAMFALLAYFGDMGCAIGPGVVGAVMKLFGENLSIGLLSGIIFPILLSLCIFSMKRNRHKPTEVQKNI